MLDWNDGKIAGFEVLGASSLLRADLIDQASELGVQDLDAAVTCKLSLVRDEEAVGIKSRRPD